MIYLNYKCPLCGKMLYYCDKAATFDDLERISRWRKGSRCCVDIYTIDKIHECIENKDQLIKYSFVSASTEQLPNSEEIHKNYFY